MKACAALFLLAMYGDALALDMFICVDQEGIRRHRNYKCGSDEVTIDKHSYADQRAIEYVRVSMRYTNNSASTGSTPSQQSAQDDCESIRQRATEYSMGAKPNSAEQMRRTKDAIKNIRAACGRLPATFVTPSTPPPPPVPIINTRTGQQYIQAAGGIIDPGNGQFLPDVGPGYINPTTGTFMPKQ